MTTDAHETMTPLLQPTMSYTHRDACYIYSQCLLILAPQIRRIHTQNGVSYTEWHIYIQCPPISARQRRFIGTVTACTFTRNSALYPHKTPYTRRDAFYIYTSLFRVHQVALYANVKCVTVCRWHRCVCIRRPCGVGIRWRCVWMLMVLLCVGNGFVCK